MPGETISKGDIMRSRDRYGTRATIQEIALRGGGSCEKAADLLEAYISEMRKLVDEVRSYELFDEFDICDWVQINLNSQRSYLAEAILGKEQYDEYREANTRLAEQRRQEIKEWKERCEHDKPARHTEAD